MHCTIPKGACVAVAALMQYFLMAAFCWMLVEGIYLYLLVVKVYNIDIKMIVCHVVSWGKFLKFLPWLKTTASPKSWCGCYDVSQRIGSMQMSCRCLLDFNDIPYGNTDDSPLVFAAHYMLYAFSSVINCYELTPLNTSYKAWSSCYSNVHLSQSFRHGKNKGRCFQNHYYSACYPNIF